MPSEDFLLPFLLESSAIRGCLVRLGPSIDVILRQHDYPWPVGELLGEVTAMTAALGSALKFDGVFTLQMKGSGPVGMLVADVTSQGGVRAYAQFDPAGVYEAKNLLGKGNLVFTLDQTGSHERYQGIVQMEEGESLCAAIQTYFRKSEQIPTGLLVAASREDSGAARAACLMLQRMPREGGIDAPTDTSIEDDWRRTMILMQSCTKEEMTDFTLPAEDLLFRLFHEEGVRVFDSKTFRHACRCGQEKIGNFLAAMPESEINAMMEKGVVTITCQFCNKTYTFTPQEVKLFRA